MRVLITRLDSSGRREKVLVTDGPDLGAPVGNEIKTQTLYSGITNGTERNQLVGGNYATPEDKLPVIQGNYQNVGRVIQIGPEVVDLTVGDLVFNGAQRGVGDSKAGHVETIRIAEDRLLRKIPENVDPIHAAMFGMGSVGLCSCRNADLRLGERVLIVGGAGCIGQIAAQIATVMGARVTVCDIDQRRLDLTRTIGAAEEVVNISAGGWDQHIDHGTYDVVIDLAGVPGMEDRLIEAVRRKGRVLLISGRWEVTYTFRLGQEREITIKQNTHFDRNDLENLCRLVAQGSVQIGPIIQDVVPVDQADRIYVTLRDDPSQLMGTVFEW